MTTKPLSSVLVAGAGVAGLTAAYWFARSGVDVTVVERAPELRTGGHAVDFRGQAVEALRRLELLDPVRDRAIGDVQTLYVDRRGRRRSAVPREVTGGDLEVVRGDLVRLLADRARAAGARIRFGAGVAELTSTAADVTVVLDDGTATTVDLVVAADGAHSATRALAFQPEDVTEHRLGYGAAVFPVDNLLGLRQSARFHSVPGRTAGLTSYGPPDQALASFYFVHDREASPSRDALRAAVTQGYATDGWIVPQLLERFSTAPDVYLDVMSQITARRYSRDRVVLLGDAGYCASPLSGGGTSLAVLGAYVLVTETVRSGVPEALEAYERRMRPAVTAYQGLADSAGQFFVPANRAMIALRDLTYRTLPHLPWRGVFARVADDAAEAISLPAA